MPCALTSPDNYPDYLEGILKEIDAGNDENLKACACSLKTPTTDEGCPIVDEDGKIGGFPFCIPLVENGFGLDTFYPLKLTLKEAMRFYWLSRWSTLSVEILSAYVDPWFSCPGPPIIRCLSGSKTFKESVSSLDFTFNGSILNNNTSKVCPGLFNLSATVNSENINRSCPPCSTPCDPLAPVLTEIGIISAFEAPFISYDEENNIVIYGSRMVMNKEGGEYYFYPYFNLLYMSYGGAITTNLSQLQNTGLLPCYFGCTTENKSMSVKFPGFKKNLDYFFKKYNSYNPPPTPGLSYDCGQVIRICDFIKPLELNFND